ncbi:hypothetical protein KI387_041425, partial [Taxus chinensis]
MLILLRSLHSAVHTSIDVCTSASCPAVLLNPLSWYQNGSCGSVHSLALLVHFLVFDVIYRFCYACRNGYFDRALPALILG